MTHATEVDVVVVGAGVAGLLAAIDLAGAGRSVVVVDKGRSVGGRLATRRIEAPGGTARLDHGAQFFTVRTDRFRAAVDPLRAEGLVHVWARGFDPARPDGHPRFAVVDGMTTLAKRWATAATEAGAEVVTGCRIARIDADGTVLADDGRSWDARRVLVTAPVPQAVDLVGDAAPAALHAIAYDPTLCLLGILDRPADVVGSLGTIGAVQRPDGAPFEMVVDNAAKGTSSVPAVTAHLTGPESAARWDDDDEETLAFLLDAVAPLLGPARVLRPQLKRWRYATPTTLHPDPVLVQGRLAFAGDAFGRAAVEGAALSGWAAAEALLAD